MFSSILQSSLLHTSRILKSRARLPLQQLAVRGFSGSGRSIYGIHRRRLSVDERSRGEDRERRDSRSYERDEEDDDRRPPRQRRSPSYIKNVRRHQERKGVPWPRRHPDRHVEENHSRSEDAESTTLIQRKPWRLPMQQKNLGVNAKTRLILKYCDEFFLLNYHPQQPRWFPVQDLLFAECFKGWTKIHNFQRAFQDESSQGRYLWREEDNENYGKEVKDKPHLKTNDFWKKKLFVTLDETNPLNDELREKLRLKLQEEDEDISQKQLYAREKMVEGKTKDFYTTLEIVLPDAEDGDPVRTEPWHLYKSVVNGRKNWFVSANEEWRRDYYYRQIASPGSRTGKVAGSRTFVRYKTLTNELREKVGTTDESGK